MTAPFDLEDTALARLLLRRGLLPVGELRRCLEEVRRRRAAGGAGLATLLRERGLLTAAQIEDTLAARPTTPAASPPPPARLGPYVVVREIARGGMGAVHEVVHEPTGVHYALKTIQPAGLGGALNETERARFRAEAELMARLEHPHVVRIHTANLDGAPPYLVQDLLRGGSLQDLLDRLGCLSSEAAAALTAKLARGLAHAHGLGVLHRDLKPSNVLFDEHEEPRLVDFGLARELDPEGRLTATGDILGTPGYMAPEQALGLKADDPRTDVYGLGAILYACLTGGPPVPPASSLMTTLSRIVEGKITPPRAVVPEVPAALDAICLKALARDAEDRYPTAEAFAVALETGRAPAGRRRPAVPVGAALIALAALSLWLWWSRPAPAAPPAPPPTPGEPRVAEPPPDATVAEVGSARSIPTAAATADMVERLAPLLFAPIPRLMDALEAAKSLDLTRVDPGLRALFAVAALGAIDRRRALVGEQVRVSLTRHSRPGTPASAGLNAYQSEILRQGVFLWARLREPDAAFPPGVARRFVRLLGFDPYVTPAEVRVAEVLSMVLDLEHADLHRDFVAIALQTEPPRTRPTTSILRRAAEALAERDPPASQRYEMLGALWTPPSEQSPAQRARLLARAEQLARSKDPEVRATAHTASALLLLRGGDRAAAGEAIADAEEAAPSPRTATLLLHWSHILRRVGRRDDARAAARRYLERVELPARPTSVRERVALLPGLRSLWTASRSEPRALQTELKKRRRSLPLLWRLRLAWLYAHNGDARSALGEVHEALQLHKRRLSELREGSDPMRLLFTSKRRLGAERERRERALERLELVYGALKRGDLRSARASLRGPARLRPLPNGWARPRANR